MKHTKYTPSAFRAVRRLLAEVHFGGNMDDDRVGARQPDNSKFLDQRAAELAHIIDQETGAPELLAACKAALSEYHPTTREGNSTAEQLQAAIAKAEGK